MLAPEYCRSAHPATTDDAAIDAGWDERRASSPGVVLFNGTKFRLHACDAPAGCNDSLVLRLGVTDYKALCGTNFAPAHPADGGSCDVAPFMSNALGVEALVVTADDKVVLFRRSASVAENAGYYCCPGGHAEPSAALRRAARDAEVVQALAAAVPKTAATGFARFDDAAPQREAEAVYRQLTSALDATAVVEELFQSPVDEVVEELGVAPEDAVCDGLFGVVVANSNRGKPDCVFRVRLSKTAGEVEHQFLNGQVRERFESDGFLLFLSMDDVRAGRLPSDVKIAPPSLACLQLCFDDVPA